jgi:hypothetical protein
VIAAIVGACLAVVAAVSWLWRARDKAAARDREASALAAAHERGVLDEAERERERQAVATQNAIDSVPLMTDEQLEDEINK